MVSLETCSILGTQSSFLESGKQSQVYLGFEHVHFSHILKAGFKSFQTLYQK